MSGLILWTISKLVEGRRVGIPKMNGYTPGLLSDWGIPENSFLDSFNSLKINIFSVSSVVIF